MSREESFTIGSNYAYEGLTDKEYQSLVKFFLETFGNIVANGFIEGYRTNLSHVLGN